MFLGPAFRVTRHRVEGPQLTLARLAIFGVWINGKVHLYSFLSGTLADKPHMGDIHGRRWRTSMAASRLRYTNVVSLERKPAVSGFLTADPGLTAGGETVRSSQEWLQEAASAA